jgi:hypothetical protein
MEHASCVICRVPCAVLGVGCWVSGVVWQANESMGEVQQATELSAALDALSLPALPAPPSRLPAIAARPKVSSQDPSTRPAHTIFMYIHTCVSVSVYNVCVCVCTCMYKHTHSLSISNTQTHMYVCMYVCEYKGTGWVVLWRGVRGAGEDTVEGGRLWTSAHNTCAQRLLTTTAGRCRKRTRSGSCGSSKLPWLRRSVSTWLWQLYLQTQRGSVISRLNARDTHEDEDEGSKDEGSGRRRVCLVVQVGRLLAPGVLQGTDATWPLKAAVGVDHTGEEAGEDADITLLELIEHGTASWPPRQCVLCPA